MTFLLNRLHACSHKVDTETHHGHQLHDLAPNYIPSVSLLLPCPHRVQPTEMEVTGFQLMCPIHLHFNLLLLSLTFPMFCVNPACDTFCVMLP